jgi:hypothetical protein
LLNFKNRYFCHFYNWFKVYNFRQEKGFVLNGHTWCPKTCRNITPYPHKKKKGVMPFFVVMRLHTRSTLQFLHLRKNPRKVRR